MSARSSKGIGTAINAEKVSLPKAFSGIPGEVTEERIAQEFERFLKSNLTGRNREAALKCLKAPLHQFGLITVGATHHYHWIHRNMSGAEEDDFGQFKLLRKLFSDLASSCDALAGNAKAFRGSPAVRRWVRPEPMAGSPVYAFQLWTDDIPALWEAAGADALIGKTSAAKARKEDTPPLISQLEALAKLFSALERASKKLCKKGKKHIFEGEAENLIQQLHLNCLRSLHQQHADQRCFRPIARVIHWFETGEEPGPDWGKRAATLARSQFVTELGQTTQK